MNIRNFRGPIFALFVAVFLLGGCRDSRNDEAVAYDNTEEVEAYYAANPERFTFATAADIPADLPWQDGSGLDPIGDPRAKRGGQLRIRLSSMQSTLRVVGPDANGSLRGALWSANNVFLIARHPWNDGFIPGVARRWAIDPENSRRLFFELDPDARWSDGRPFTAEDVFFSLYIMLSPHINDPAVNRVYDENYINITQYDERTLSMTIGKPSPDPLASLESFIISQREFYREFGPDYTDRYHSRFAPVTGAYTLDTKDIKRGEQATFRRMEHWWADDKPFYRHLHNPDAITYVVIRDDFKAFESFLNGVVDWFPLSQTELWHDRADAEPFKKGYIERAQFYYLTPAGSMGLFMNSMKPLLDNADIRTGIQYAINYDRVNEEIHRGDRRRIRSFVDGYGAYDHPTLRAREYNLNQAQQWFAKAGFSERGPDGILRNASGQRLSFSFSVTNTAEESRISTVLKEEAERIGLELRIEQL
ncbi:MAG TPA: ABC transporter substrate-binding protein, partial [Oceanipulchritudo sp.]|nr:ABC transporter substrate-binding protein [Oceanipulchritudo sp.]